ncbi:unnamed protein product [Amoebophrya sp. A120]|nr:unnamed protein product [Amoebophrya sp. A120]|eukprot:GSA120T00003681001.1
MSTAQRIEEAALEGGPIREMPCSAKPDGPEGRKSSRTIEPGSFLRQLPIGERGGVLITPENFHQIRGLQTFDELWHAANSELPNFKTTKFMKNFPYCGADEEDDIDQSYRKQRGAGDQPSKKKGARDERNKAHRKNSRDAATSSSRRNPSDLMTPSDEKRGDQQSGSSEVEKKEEAKLYRLHRDQVVIDCQFDKFDAAVREYEQSETFSKSRRQEAQAELDKFLDVAPQICTRYSYCSKSAFQRLKRARKDRSGCAYAYEIDRIKKLWKRIGGKFSHRLEKAEGLMREHLKRAQPQLSIEVRTVGGDLFFQMSKTSPSVIKRLLQKQNKNVTELRRARHQSETFSDEDSPLHKTESEYGAIDTKRLLGAHPLDPAEHEMTLHLELQHFAALHLEWMLTTAFERLLLGRGDKNCHRRKKFSQVIPLSEFAPRAKDSVGGWGHTPPEAALDPYWDTQQRRVMNTVRAFLDEKAFKNNHYHAHKDLLKRGGGFVVASLLTAGLLNMWLLRDSLIQKLWEVVYVSEMDDAVGYHSPTNESSGKTVSQLSSAGAEKETLTKSEDQEVNLLMRMEGLTREAAREVVLGIRKKRQEMEKFDDVRQLKTGDIFKLGYGKNVDGWRCVPMGSSARALLVNVVRESYSPGNLLPQNGVPKSNSGSSVSRMTDVAKQEEEDAVMRCYACLDVRQSEDINEEDGNRRSCERAIVGYVLLPTAAVDKSDEGHCTLARRIQQAKNKEVEAVSFPEHCYAMFIEPEDWQRSGIELLSLRERNVEKLKKSSVRGNHDRKEEKRMKISAAAEFADLLEQRKALAVQRVNWIRCTFPELTSTDIPWDLLRSLSRGCEIDTTPLVYKNLWRFLCSSFADGAEPEAVVETSAGATPCASTEGGSGEGDREVKCGQTGTVTSIKNPWIPILKDKKNEQELADNNGSVKDLSHIEANVFPWTKDPQNRVVRSCSPYWNFIPAELVAGLDPDLRTFTDFYDYAAQVQKQKTVNSAAATSEFGEVVDFDEEKQQLTDEESNTPQPIERESLQPEDVASQLQFTIVISENVVEKEKVKVESNSVSKRPVMGNDSDVSSSSSFAFTNEGQGDNISTLGWDADDRHYDDDDRYDDYRNGYSSGYSY